ncbi:nitrile hydratase accessory protein [Methylobacterium sp. J-030]|uniref:nitrile hydratase accessory protein n=1 Tax=Methylobacterium sp. J-030 TaxID=2836627 RepID=UPI001FBB6B00|nr:nitrile hydratase accessory protein [Methylobacterium sp. J-030]MCJ2068847.1 nitrile hydratase accessory protein [Methylobacterium sp. J-030]
MTEPSPSPFAAPWEAQVFAMVVSLREAGLFTWSDWAERLGRGIRPADGPEGAADYGAWLATLEGILAERGVAEAESVAARTEAFRRAAAATPHGEPIRLENDPLYRP